MAKVFIFNRCFRRGAVGHLLLLLCYTFNICLFWRSVIDLRVSLIWHLVATLTFKFIITFWLLLLITKSLHRLVQITLNLLTLFKWTNSTNVWSLKQKIVKLNFLLLQAKFQQKYFRIWRSFQLKDYSFGFHLIVGLTWLKLN